MGYGCKRVHCTLETCEIGYESNYPLHLAYKEAVIHLDAMQWPQLLVYTHLPAGVISSKQQRISSYTVTHCHTLSHIACTILLWDTNLAVISVYGQACIYSSVLIFHSKMGPVVL